MFWGVPAAGSKKNHICKRPGCREKLVSNIEIGVRGVSRQLCNFLLSAQLGLVFKMVVFKSPHGIDFIFSGIFVFCFNLGRLTVRATSLATLLAAARQWLRDIGNYLMFIKI